MYVCMYVLICAWPIVQEVKWKYILAEVYKEMVCREKTTKIESVVLDE